MAEFNYTEYLKNNPLLQEEIKEKLLTESQKITEGIPQGSEIADYVEGMFNSDVVEKEGFQSDIWRKEQYASNDYREGSVFLDLVDHLKSVGGKDVLEGNPDIHLELLSNDDIQWSADVTLDENLAEEEIPTPTLTKINAEVKNVQTMAQAILDFIAQVQEKEEVDFGANANMKIVLDRLNTLAKTEEKETEAVAESEEVTEEEIYESALAQKLRDEAKHPDSKVGAAIFNKYAEKVEKANKEDYVKLLKDMESELISKHPDTFSGEDDIPGSFLSEEVPSSKMKVSELKAKIKEDIISLLQEEEEEEDVEADIEDEVDIDVEEPAVDAAPEGGAEGLTSDEKEIQDALKLAYDNAIAIGDQKLADQIGNSITFFTRTHVVER